MVSPVSQGAARYKQTPAPHQLVVFMATKTKDNRIPFRLHPRVFAALGSDLVTNDFVAITELVKNSYDAFADRVDVRFRTDETRGDYIEIQDNGFGMDRVAVETVWCVVATPYRVDNPVSRKGNKTRRTAGEKGLGRLSMARLGNRLEMLTQAKGQPCLRVAIEWTGLSRASSLDLCFASIEENDGPSPFKPSGTLHRIYDLQAEWSNERLEELHEHLSRLLSPFSGVEDFAIWLYPKDESVKPAAKIASPDFLKNPKYRLAVTADASGSRYVKAVPTGIVGKRAIHDRVLSMDGEGTVWKRLNQPYVPGHRVRHWLKRKRGIEIEAFVSGFKNGTEDRGHRELVGAVEFSVHDPDGARRSVAWVRKTTASSRSF